MPGHFFSHGFQALVERRAHHGEAAVWRDHLRGAMCKNEYNDEDSHKKQNELRCARGKSGSEEQGLKQTSTIGGRKRGSNRCNMSENSSRTLSQGTCCSEHVVVRASRKSAKVQKHRTAMLYICQAPTEAWT